MPTALSKKNRNMTYTSDDESDPTESEKGNIVQLSSSFDTKTLVSSNTENANNKDENDSSNISDSIDESSCSSSDEHTKKQISNKTTSESKKLRKLAAQLATKFDIKTLETLAFLGPTIDNFKIARSEVQSKSLGFQMSTAENEVEMSRFQSSESADKFQSGLINNTNVNALKSDDVKNIVPTVKISGLDNMFTKDMFLVKDPALGTALNEAKSIYCLQEKYTQAENATSATMAGRRLLDGVFTREALSICSLSGMPPRGKGKSAYADKSSVKPYLCPKAITAILEKALQFQKIKHWHPKKDSSQIKHAMAVRINEVATQYAKENL